MNTFTGIMGKPVRNKYNVHGTSPRYMFCVSGKQFTTGPNTAVAHVIKNFVGCKVEVVYHETSSGIRNVFNIRETL